MGLFKRLAGLLGLGRDEEAEKELEQQRRQGEENADSNVPSSSSSTLPPFAAAAHAANHLPRRGFSVPVQVPVDRGPILVPCPSGDGGVQGLRWYTRCLRIDEDGDVADEFLVEVLPGKSENVNEDHLPSTRFEVKYNTRPAKVRNLALSHDGKLKHCVEFQGRLEWV